MADVSSIRETIHLDEGDVIVLLPGSLSQKSVTVLQAKLASLAAGANAGGGEDGHSSLPGLAGLAAYLANR